MVCLFSSALSWQLKISTARATENISDKGHESAAARTRPSVSFMLLSRAVIAWLCLLHAVWEVVPEKKLLSISRSLSLTPWASISDTTSSSEPSLCIRLPTTADDGCSYELHENHSAKKRLWSSQITHPKHFISCKSPDIQKIYQTGLLKIQHENQ